MKYAECTINAHHAGFGMFETGEINGEIWDSLSDLLFEMGAVYDDFTPLEDALAAERFVGAGIENIAGKCHRQPAYLYASLSTNSHTGAAELRYHGIAVVAEAGD